MINKLINSGLKLNNRIVKQTDRQTDAQTYRETHSQIHTSHNTYTCKSDTELTKSKT